MPDCGDACVHQFPIATLARHVYNNPSIGLLMLEDTRFLACLLG